MIYVIVNEEIAVLAIIAIRKLAHKLAIRHKAQVWASTAQQVNLTLFVDSFAFALLQLQYSCPGP